MFRYCQPTSSSLVTRPMASCFPGPRWSFTMVAREPRIPLRVPASRRSSCRSQAISSSGPIGCGVRELPAVSSAENHCARRRSPEAWNLASVRRFVRVRWAKQWPRKTV